LIVKSIQNSLLKSREFYYTQKIKSGETEASPPDIQSNRLAVDMHNKTRYSAGWVRSPEGFTLPIFRSTGGLQSAAGVEIPFTICSDYSSIPERTLHTQFTRQ